MTDSVRYIIVVHGIGDQRKNETTIAVVNRIAAQRRGGAKSTGHSEVLTLGRASGQTGKDELSSTGVPWMEFGGIPGNESTGNISAPFVTHYSHHGGNMRFVDMSWSQVMERDYQAVGQEMSSWARGLLGRISLRAGAPTWMERTLAGVRRRRFGGSVCHEVPLQKSGRHCFFQVCWRRSVIR
jgi:hypothetical protein